MGNPEARQCPEWDRQCCRVGPPVPQGGTAGAAGGTADAAGCGTAGLQTGGAAAWYDRCMRVRPSLLGLHHLALNARDLPVMKRFYVEVLGFRVEWEPDAENVYLTSGSDNLVESLCGG